MKTDLEKIFRSQEDLSPAWLQDFRQKGYESFLAQGLPTVKQEDWKYTSVKPLAEKQFAPAEASFAFKPSAWSEHSNHRLVFLNESYQPELSQAAGLPEGVSLLPLSQALQQEEDLLKTYLGKILDSQNRPFVALGEAFLQEGFFLKIAKGVVVEKPIELLHGIFSPASTTMQHPRVFIYLEEGAEATLLEHYTRSPSPQAAWTNVATEILLRPASQLCHVRLQEEPDNHYYFNSTAVQVERDASFQSFSLDLGARLNRQEYCIHLDAPGAQTMLKGLYLAQGQQHTDFQTLLHHRHPQGTSRELFKGILDGRAHGVFNGQIVVDPGAQKTVSELTNKNLLLSREAQIDTKPLLKIFADDVKCSHGATIGRLDEDELFYFRSRGIDQNLAKHLLTYAFAAEIWEDLPEGKLKNYLNQRLHERLGIKEESHP